MPPEIKVSKTTVLYSPFLYDDQTSYSAVMVDEGDRLALSLDGADIYGGLITIPLGDVDSLIALLSNARKEFA